MNNILLDVIVPICEVDVSTFRRNYIYIKNNLPTKKIVVIAPRSLENRISDLQDVDFLDEDAILPGLSLSRIKSIKKEISGNERRAGWYFQQFLKMAYAEICSDDYYLIWDSDTIPIKQMSFFDNDSGKPFMDYRDYVKYDECFFITQKLLFPNEYLKKTLKWSFICEHLLVNTSIMRNLLEDLANEGAAGKTTFYENVMHVIPRNLINLSGFSEFETYAAYVLKLYPDLYVLRHWNNLRNAGIYIGAHITKNNLEWLSDYYDVISIEDFNAQWAICDIFLKFDPKHRIGFKYIYKMIQPMYNWYYAIRMKIRNMLVK